MEVFLIITVLREGLFTQFSKISQKEVKNSRNQGFFLLFLLDDRVIRIRIRSSD